VTPARLGEISRSDRGDLLVFSLRRELLAWANLPGNSLCSSHAGSLKIIQHPISHTGSSKHELITQSSNSITHEHISYEIWRKVSFPYLFAKNLVGGIKQFARQQSFQFNLGESITTTWRRKNYTIRLKIQRLTSEF